MPLIIKASGQTEHFSAQKLQNSLLRAGADIETAKAIIQQIELWLMPNTSTRKIYARAFMLLRSMQRSAAARYSLKNAIMELGPSGYAFEEFVGHIFRQQGFDCLVGVEVQGHCISHEMDVVATNNKVQHLVECKYYNSPDKNAHVQVSLYVRSRVNDIIKKRQQMAEFKGLDFYGWVVTNTRFTPDALAFGECSGLKLMSWDYPQHHSLKDKIEQFRLFPVTVLTHLTKTEKQLLLSKNIVLCKQVIQNLSILDLFELTIAKRNKLIKELNDLCS